MAGVRSGRSGIVLAVCGAVLFAAGCGNGDTPGSGGTSTASTSAVEAAKFDPCTDIPESVLSVDNLKRGQVENSKAGDVTWTGCSYVERQGNGYAVRIVTTNLTLERIKAKYPDSYRESDFAGRKGAFYALHPDSGTESCTANIEMAAGTLEFDMDNPKSAPKTGTQEPCDLLTKLARQVVPTIPAGA